MWCHAPALHLRTRETLEHFICADSVLDRWYCGQTIVSVLTTSWVVGTAARPASAMTVAAPALAVCATFAAASSCAHPARRPSQALWRSAASEHSLCLSIRSCNLVVPCWAAEQTKQCLNCHAASHGGTSGQQVCESRFAVREGGQAFQCMNKIATMLWPRACYRECMEEAGGLACGCASRQPACPPAPGAAIATDAPGASCSRAASHRRRAPSSRRARRLRGRRAARPGKHCTSTKRCRDAYLMCSVRADSRSVRCLRCWRAAPWRA